MNSIVENLYEMRKKDLTCEIYFIEGVQYNFKLEDMQNLLGVITKEDLGIFKKYLYYLDEYRSSFLYIENEEDAIEKFSSILMENEEENAKILELFQKQEKLFCNEEGKMKLELVPRKYNTRIFNGYDDLKKIS